MYTKAPKSEYTEAEAAMELGVPVDRLRALIRDQILSKDDDTRTLSTLTFQPSDLVLLKLLAAQTAAE